MKCRVKWLAGLSLVIGLASACERPPPSIAGLVVGEALRNLGADGRVRLEAPTPLSASAVEISEIRARKLAAAFLISFPKNIPLRLCGRSWYATSAFEPLPGWVPSGEHFSLGPWWLVSLCGKTERPLLSLAISAYATALGISTDGGLDFRSHEGGGLIPREIPKTMLYGLPMSPERAVEIAAKVSGARVAGVPELIAPGPGWSPQTAHWRLPLERSVTLSVRDSSGKVHRINGVKEIFVGTYWSRFPESVQIARVDQPNPQRLSRISFPTEIWRGQFRFRPDTTVTIVRRANYPLRYLDVVRR